MVKVNDIDKPENISNELVKETKKLLMLIETNDDRHFVMNQLSRIVMNRKGDLGFI